MNGYLIDSNQRIVYYDTSEIQLTNKEFDLLSYFVKNKNNLVSRDQILFSISFINNEDLDNIYGNNSCDYTWYFFYIPCYFQTNQ